MDNTKIFYYRSLSGHLENVTVLYSKDKQPEGTISLLSSNLYQSREREVHQEEFTKAQTYIKKKSKQCHHPLAPLTLDLLWGRPPLSVRIRHQTRMEPRLRAGDDVSAPPRIHPGFLQFLQSVMRHKALNGRKWRYISHSEFEETNKDDPHKCMGESVCPVCPIHECFFSPCHDG